MIRKESISIDNIESLMSSTAKLREDIAKQDEALVDVRMLKQFAEQNNLKDRVVELLFEEALIHQHRYMVSKDNSFLLEMKRSVDLARNFVETNRLSVWESRVARFRGRVADYEGNYSEAITHYTVAIEKVQLDPRYEGNHALAYEYRGFLVIDELRVRGLSEGIDKAEKLYRDYDETDEGKELKLNDYTTWAIWRTGVLINLCRVLIDMGRLDDYKNRIVSWLDLAENDLRTPEGVSTWSDFSFRKKEIDQVRDLLVN